MPIFLLFVFIVFTSIMGTIFFGIRDGKSSLNFQISVLIFAYVVACYFIGFLLLCIYPYWTDNGAEEFIPFEDRWKWATLDFYLLAIVLCPLLFWGYKTISSRHLKKKNEKTITSE